MLTIDQQIEEIKKYIRKTPYHKGTEREIGLLKAKIARLKAKKEAAASKGSSGRGVSYGVKKQGDATIVLVGPPSAGKSTLLNKLTNAESKVAPYSFTTVSVIPGMMDYNGAHIQVLDVPGLIEGAEEGKGRGREVISVVRGADLLVLMSDVTRPEAIKRISKALERNGIRIDKTKPDIKVEKKFGGGLVVKTNIKQELDNETIKDISKELGVKNAEISINEKATAEGLIDAFSKNRVYIPSLKILNKSDKLKTKKLNKFVYISAESEEGLEKFRAVIWEKLDLAKIYLIKRNENPSENNPLIVGKSDSLKKVAEKLGSEFAQGKKRAKIWGNGAKFEGQEVSLKTKVQDGMMVRFI